MGKTYCEAESKEKHGVWDTLPELTYNPTLCQLQRMYYGHWATLCKSRLYPPVWDLGFGPAEQFVNSFYFSDGQMVGDRPSGNGHLISVGEMGEVPSE